MDVDWFDHLMRLLGSSRPSVLAGLASPLLGAGPLALRGEDATAKPIPANVLERAHEAERRFLIAW